MRVSERAHRGSTASREQNKGMSEIEDLIAPALSWESCESFW